MRFWIPPAFLLLGAQMLAQPPVDSRNRYERVMAIVPMIGSGTKADPFRPEYAPAASQPGVPPDEKGIVAFACQYTTDGKYALCEFVARNRAAFKTLLADRRPDVRVFEKGKAQKADIETAFKALRSDFDLDKMEVHVQ